MTQDIVEQQGQDKKIQDTAKQITDTLQAAFDTLIERRDTAYAAAIVPLDAQSASLSQERAAIWEAARNLELLLPAKARIAQYEADKLTVEGKSEEAKAKLEEMRQAENAPVAMRERQAEISARIEAIDEEKRDIARHIFNDWYPSCREVVRAAERGLFLILLEGLEESFYTYQETTGTGTSDNRQRPLLHQGRFAELTADERSMEWLAGTKWYGVGGRRR